MRDPSACVITLPGKIMHLTPPLMIDLSGERCARSVHGLSSLTRGQLEAFLEATARASASVVVVRARRPKPAKIPRGGWRGRLF